MGEAERIVCPTAVGPGIIVIGGQGNGVGMLLGPFSGLFFRPFASYSLGTGGGIATLWVVVLMMVMYWYYDC